MSQRSFSQDRKMVADQIHSWLGAAVSIGLAVAAFGAISLAVGAVVGAVAGGIVIIKFAPPPRFGFDPARRARCWPSGYRWPGSFVVFLVGNVDNFIVGHLARRDPSRLLRPGLEPLELAGHDVLHARPGCCPRDVLPASA